MATSPMDSADTRRAPGPGSAARAARRRRQRHGLAALPGAADRGRARPVRRHLRRRRTRGRLQSGAALLAARRRGRRGGLRVPRPRLVRGPRHPPDHRRAGTQIDRENGLVVVGETHVLPFDKLVLAVGLPADPPAEARHGPPGRHHLPRPRRRGGDPQGGRAACPGDRHRRRPAGPRGRRRPRAPRRRHDAAPRHGPADGAPARPPRRRAGEARHGGPRRAGDPQGRHRPDRGRRPGRAPRPGRRHRARRPTSW